MTDAKTKKNYEEKCLELKAKQEELDLVKKERDELEDSVAKIASENASLKMADVSRIAEKYSITGEDADLICKELKEIKIWDEMLGDEQSFSIEEARLIEKMRNGEDPTPEEKEIAESAFKRVQKVGVKIRRCRLENGTKIVKIASRVLGLTGPKARKLGVIEAWDAIKEYLLQP